MSDYLENKITDHLFRGQSYTPPATLWFALFTASPNDAGGGTEVSGGSYARASLAASLANFAGTQGAGTTTASSGTSGATSNNVAVTFPTPTASWGTVTHIGVFDASTGGNLLFHNVLTTPVLLDTTSASVTIPVGQFTHTMDV
jgi:hypothetical protein